MRLLVRITLACSLLLQALPGVGWPRCPANAPANAAPACACCGPEAGGGCAPAMGDTAACACGDPRPLEPQAPAAPGQNPVERAVGVLPALVAVLPVEPPSATVPSRPHHQHPRWSSVSVQSLLCVWLM